MKELQSHEFLEIDKVDGAFEVTIKSLREEEPNKQSWTFDDVEDAILFARKQNPEGMARNIAIMNEEHKQCLRKMEAYIQQKSQENRLSFLAKQKGEVIEHFTLFGVTVDGDSLYKNIEEDNEYAHLPNVHFVYIHLLVETTGKPILVSTTMFSYPEEDDAYYDVVIPIHENASYLDDNGDFIIEQKNVAFPFKTNPEEEDMSTFLQDIKLPNYIKRETSVLAELIRSYYASYQSLEETNNPYI